MSGMELVKLFDVIAPTLRAAIRAVYKSGVLQPCEVERRIRLPNGYYAEDYALPMVVALTITEHQYVISAPQQFNTF